MESKRKVASKVKVGKTEKPKTDVKTVKKQKSVKRATTKKEQTAADSYQLLINSIDGIIWEADATTFEFSFVSQQAERLLGYPLARWTNEPTFWKDHIYEADQNWAVNYCIACTRDMIPHEFEYRMIAADGRIVWLRDNVTVIIKDNKPSRLHGVMMDITAHKQTEEALRESELRFRGIFEQAGVGVAQIETASGKFVRVNQAYCDIVGYSREEMEQMDFQSITHAYDLKIDFANMELLKSGEISEFTIEKRYFTKSGRVVWVNLTVSPMWAKGETPNYHIAMVQDITARKQAENALRRNQFMLARTENISQVGSWEWDVETGTVIWSEGLFNIFQRNPSDGAPSYAEQSKLYQPEDMQRLNNAVEAAISDGTPYELELRAIRKDGAIRICQARGHAEIEPNQRATRLYGSLQDITERKQIENALRESETKLRTIFDTMSEGVALNEIIYDKNGEMIDYRILEVNQAFYLTAAYNGVDVVGQLASEAYGMSQELIKEFWKTHRIQNVVQHVEMASPVNEQWFYISTSPFIANKFVTSFFDITERKRAEKKLNEQNEYLGTLHELTIEMLQHTDLNELLGIIALRAAALTHASYGFIFLAEGDNLILRASTGKFGSNIGTYEPKPGSGVLGRVWQSRQPFTIENYDTWEERDPNYKEWNIHAIAGVPIMVNDSILGVLEVARINQDQSLYSSDEINFLIQFAEKASLILNDMQLYENAQKEIAERKQAEEALRKSESKFRLLFENMQEGFSLNEIILDENDKTRDFRILDANKAYEDHTGFKPQNVIGKTMREILPQVDPRQIENYGKVALTGEPQIIEYYSKAFGKYFRVRAFSPKRGQFATIFEDISERKMAEEAVHESEERFRSLSSMTTEGIMIHTNGVILDMNQAFANLWGYPTAEDLIGKNVFELMTVTPESRQTITDHAKTGSNDVYEVIAKRVDGTLFPGETQAKEIFYLGKPARVVLMRDITDRKLAEEKINASLLEKETLLKEIHHRVKNNLQVISSLLYLQSRTNKDENVQAMFRESQNRIGSMALIHEKLYQSKDLAHIDFAEYVRDLGHSLIHTYGVDHSRVDLYVEADEFTLNINNAVPCGLMINEIVSNSLKYAFPDQRHGSIRIRLEIESAERFKLTLSDDGVGLPADFETHSKGSLGTKLIERLAEQIHGKLERSSSSQGTSYVISFPRTV